MRIPVVEALRGEKTTPIFPVDEQNISKDTNYSAWVLQQLVEPPENVCVRPKTPPKPLREKQTAKNVVRVNSPGKSV